MEGDETFLAIQLASWVHKRYEQCKIEQRSKVLKIKPHISS